MLISHRVQCKRYISIALYWKFYYVCIRSLSRKRSVIFNFCIYFAQISSSILSSSPSGQTQGYRALTHMVQGAPLQRDHMTQPPHPPPDLHSSHTTVQQGRPRGSQSSFTTQHHNAGWSRYGEGSLKRSASFSSIQMLNDFGSNTYREMSGHQSCKSYIF